ncbi:MAG: hypothetical protein STHCBS139747_000469 [Sporothrix thermara]
MTDFSFPHIPDGMEGDFMLMPEQSKENGEKRKAWFREQADREARDRAETRRRETERESARRLAIRERDLLDDLTVEARQQNGKWKNSNAKKHNQPGARTSVTPTAFGPVQGMVVSEEGDWSDASHTQIHV